jgi:two-component system, NtrC family, nitrogen regulation sensor histidine kinase NtrY
MAPTAQPRSRLPRGAPRMQPAAAAAHTGRQPPRTLRRMRLPGRIELRFAFAFLMVTLLPLLLSTALSYAAVEQAIDIGESLYASPEIVREVELSLGVYSDLARSMKDTLKARADAIAAQEPLRAAAILRHEPSIDQELSAVSKLYPDLVSITITVPDGEGEGAGTRRIGYYHRGRPIDEATERSLEVHRALADREAPPEMTAVFAAPRARLDQIEHVSAWLQFYKNVVHDGRPKRGQGLLIASSVLIAATVLLSVSSAFWMARQLTRRINALAGAAADVGGGNLSVRVAEKGDDELTALSRAFNRMVGEVQESRARIEFLQRMGTWQEMARRLAHEIKNPLTPIQLAVQECHRRYEGENKAFRKLLDTTVEIVEEEVGTLRRLVTEFSDFARMPRADLVHGDLGDFLREQRTRLTMLEGDEEPAAGALAGVSVEWSVPERALPAAFDPIMLHRVLVNVVGNAAQAIQGGKGEGGRVRVSAEERPGVVEVDVDDDGPGVPSERREQIFDPYFTTKSEGTGLGLAIVKKVVMEHGGSIEALASPLGGARMRIRLPLAGTPASEAALSSSERPSGPAGQAGQAGQAAQPARPS